MQKSFSVSQVSKLAGVSVRTLHHYDQIGLLTPLRQQVLQHLAMQNRFLSQMMTDEAYEGLTFETFMMLTEALIEEELAQQMYAYYDPALPEHLYEAMMYFAEHSFKAAPEQYRFIGVEKADS